MLNSFFKQRQGFTLIEIVAVLAILGMMAIMLMPSIDIASNKAKDTKMVSDLVSLDSAVKLYRMENKEYPSNLDELRHDGYVVDKIYKDAKNNEFEYDFSKEADTYTLTGEKSNGDVINANGKKIEKKKDSGSTDANAK